MTQTPVMQAAPTSTNSTRSGEKFARLRSGINLCFETFGNPDNPTVLLVMGLGGPMTMWPDVFCEKLVQRGFHVVRFDHRDTGRSTKLRHYRVRTRDVLRAYLGAKNAPYGIDDFVDDAVGLLDHLEVERAHLVGISMGGMIVQQFAITHPDRTASLTSIMSTTGSRRVGWIAPKLMPQLLKSVGKTREAYVESVVAAAKIFASPAFAPDEEQLRATARLTYDRGWIASGVTRHMLAVLTQRDRTADLRNLDVPAAVIHGQSDLMVHRTGGKATAAAIPGAQLLEIAGMGHDLPPVLYDPIIELITRTAARRA